MPHERYTDFRTIPQFVRDGRWQCDYNLDNGLHFIDEMVQTDNLDLDPDFQRRFCWSESQEIAWIEFFLKGGQTGRVIYLNHPNWQNNGNSPLRPCLVDGKQRLKAIRRFVNNEIRVFGTPFKDFTGRPLGCNSLKVNVNTLQTRADVLKWYLGMNGGGVPHSKHELERVWRLLEQEQSK